MANGENKDKSKSIKIDAALYEYIKSELDPPIGPKDFSKFIRSSLLFSVDAFAGSPLLFNHVWELWTAKYALNGFVTSTIPFRLQSSVDEWVLKNVERLKSDFTTVVIRSMLFYLPFYRRYPQSMGTLYTRWLESQSQRCITAPHQLEINRKQG